VRSSPSESALFTMDTSRPGDANNGDDYWTLNDSQVLGTPALTVPYVGYFLVFLRQSSGALALVSLMLAISLAWSMFFGDSSVVHLRDSSDSLFPPVSRDHGMRCISASLCCCVGISGAQLVSRLPDRRFWQAAYISLIPPPNRAVPHGGREKQSSWCG
jgi:hypothetical protein